MTIEETVPDTSDTTNTQETTSQSTDANSNIQEAPEESSFFGGKKLTEYSADELKLIKDKGFKDTTDVLNSYASLQRKLGADILPKDNSESELNAFYEKIGVPKTTDEYGIQITNPEDTELLNVALKCRLNPLQAKNLINLVNQVQQDELKAEQEVYQQQYEAMASEWGEARSSHESLLQKGLEIQNITNEQLQLISKIVGIKQATSLFMNIGRLKSDATGYGGISGGSTSETLENYINRKRNG